MSTRAQLGSPRCSDPSRSMADRSHACGRRGEPIRAVIRTRWLLVGAALLAGAVSVGALVAPPTGFQPIMTAEQLLGVFDLARPELSQVAALSRTGRTREA